MNKHPKPLSRAAGIGALLFRRGKMVVRGVYHRSSFFRPFNLIESYPDSNWRGDCIYETDGNQSRDFDAGSEIDYVKIKRGLHDFRAIRRPVRITRCPARERPIGIATCGFVNDDMRDLRMEARNRKALLAAHTRSHYD